MYFTCLTILVGLLIVSISSVMLCLGLLVVRLLLIGCRYRGRLDIVVRLTVGLGWCWGRGLGILSLLGAVKKFNECGLQLLITIWCHIVRRKPMLLLFWNEQKRCHKKEI